MQTEIEAISGKEGGHRLVGVTVDGQPKQIEQGQYLISELKVVLGVPADYELDRVNGGQFKKLDDDERVQVHKGEVFVSHVRRGGSA